MTIHPRYDAEVDALYLRFADAAIVESEEVMRDVVMDFDVDGRIVGIEFLSASQRLAKGAV
jgi:uncharacterized protein YuzE